MRGMSAGQLCEKYLAVFGEPPRSRHKERLIRRIAWRLQVLEEGDLSERARRRAVELANDADLRTLAPRDRETADPAPIKIPTVRDNRLPKPGTILARQYRGHTIEVRVRKDGLEFNGQVYKTLTAVAKAVTGAHWNGYHFFGLGKQGE